MLIKLLKYDLKYMIKNMSIFYILSIFFALTTRILFNMEQSIIINIIGQISVGCMFAMVINTLINTIMRSSFLTSATILLLMDGSRLITKRISK